MLPDKASDLIDNGMRDLEVIENTEGYRIDMSDWHEFYTDDSGDGAPVCSCCLAGAVMSRTLAADPDQTVYPKDYERDTYRKLHALDDFRRGRVERGLKRMHLAIPNILPITMRISRYEDDRDGFKKEMACLSASLREIGL